MKKTYKQNQPNVTVVHRAGKKSGIMIGENLKSGSQQATDIQRLLFAAKTWYENGQYAGISDEDCELESATYVLIKNYPELFDESRR